MERTKPICPLFSTSVRKNEPNGDPPSAAGSSAGLGGSTLAPAAPVGNIASPINVLPTMTQFRVSLLSLLQKPLLILTLLAAPAAQVHAQSPPGAPPPDDLFRTIASLDSALFASASYDRCDLEAFKAFFAEDAEFYHDQSGLTVGSETVAEQMKQNICGKVRRELVAGTLQVYPMHGYGAVETGVHRFYQPKIGNEATGEAKFIHLWQNKDGAWKITRVISYDHAALKK
jgi:hypothetical protein